MANKHASFCVKQTRSQAVSQPVGGGDGDGGNACDANDCSAAVTVSPKIIISFRAKCIYEPFRVMRIIMLLVFIQPERKE